MPPRSLLAAFLVLAAACTAAPEPVAPPTSASASASPKLEGVYYFQSPEGVDLLRFTSARKVLSLSTASQQSLESAVRLLIAESDRCASGTYAIKEGILRFTLTSKAGTVDYAGAIKDDKLAARWRSGINGASVEETYTFVKVVDEAAETAANPDRPPTEDADAGAPSAPTGPELTLIPDGAAWYCFRTSGASRCERKQAACDAARKSAAAAHRDTKMGKCTKQASAYCYTATKGAAHGMASCSATEADCKAEASGLEPGSDVSISVCAKQ